MQFVYAQLKLIESIFGVIVRTEIFPEFWNDLMPQHIIDIQPNCFINIFCDIQSNPFVDNESQIGFRHIARFLQLNEPASMVFDV